MLLNNLLCIRYQMRVIGRRNLPQGRAVIACNHPAYTDFRFHLKAVSQPLRFLGIRDSTAWGSLNVLIRLLFRLTLGAVDRLLEGFVIFMEKGKPMAPSLVRRILRLLQGRCCLVIMSEGRVSGQEQEHPFHRGIGYFALKTGCSVVPVAVSVQKRGILARRVLYRIGEPIAAPDGGLRLRRGSYLYTRAVNRRVEELLRLNEVGAERRGAAR